MSYLSGLADRVNKMDAKNNFNLLEVEIDNLIPSENNFYGIREIEELAESIKLNGLMHNLVVRKLEDGKYEIISGHRRFHAMKTLEFEKIPCQVKNASNLDSEIMLIQANAQQRETTHLEKMKAIERLTELYKQKKENGEEIPKGKTRDLIGKDIGLSGVQVGRYKKVSEKLIEPLKSKLDDGNITLTQATTLSGLKENEQEIILDQIRYLGTKDSKQEVDILVEGIKQPVESKKDKDFIKEMYEPAVLGEMLKETKAELRGLAKETKITEDIKTGVDVIKEILKQDPRPKIIISNEFLECINYTQEVSLNGDIITALSSGFTRTNYVKFKIINARKIDEITLFDNKVITPRHAYEIAPGAYLWFVNYKED